jgi:hypothetical protein
MSMISRNRFVRFSSTGDGHHQRRNRLKNVDVRSMTIRRLPSSPVSPKSMRQVSGSVALVPLSGRRDMRIWRASVGCTCCAGWCPAEDWRTIARRPEGTLKRWPELR